MNEDTKRPEDMIEEDALQEEALEEETQEEAAEELKEQLLRALAEAENIRRRAARDHEDARKYAVTSFARDLLSVADNFSRAMDVIANEDTTTFPPAVQSMIEGIKLTKKELNGILEKHGVKKLNPMGEPFNHDYHQAIVEIPTPEQPAGTVVQVMQSGYTLHDRLLRPAMVGVAKSPE